MVPAPPAPGLTLPALSGPLPPMVPAAEVGGGGGDDGDDGGEAATCRWVADAVLPLSTAALAGVDAAAADARGVTPLGVLAVRRAFANVQAWLGPTRHGRPYRDFSHPPAGESAAALATSPALTASLERMLARPSIAGTVPPPFPK